MLFTKGLALQNLSRCSADGGAVTSPLVPWNVCGVFVSGTLGVSTYLIYHIHFFVYYHQLYV